jgi:hypothetical protein
LPERVNQSGQSGRLIPAAGIVEKVSGEGWAPVSQDLNQASLCYQIRERILHRSSNADSFQYRLDNQVWIVERCWSLGADRERLSAFFELPSIETVAEAKTDAGMIFQILRVSGRSVRRKIFWSPNYGKTHFFGHPDRDHIPLDELTELNACVILSCNNIHRIVRGSDLQYDLRISASKPGKFRENHHLSGSSRDHQPDFSRGSLSLLPSLRNRFFNPFERRRKFVKESRARGSWRDTSRGPRQQLQPQPLFEAAHGVAQSRLRNPQARGGTRKTALLGDDCEGREFSQIILHNS